MSINTLEYYKSRYHFYKKQCRQMGNMLESVRQQLNLIPTVCLDSPTPNTPTVSTSKSVERIPTLGTCTGPTVKRRLFKPEPSELHNFARPNLKRSLVHEDISSDDEIDFSLVCGANKWECEEETESSNDSSNDRNDPSDLANLKRMQEERAHKIQFISTWIGKSIASKIREEESE